MSKPQKVHYDGDRLFPEGEYDHIFNIDLETGEQKLLPYNNGGT
jgi:hypothetical protein